jgi:predicted PurR-regulated permease PerM
MGPRRKPVVIEIGSARPAATGRFAALRDSRLAIAALAIAFVYLLHLTAAVTLPVVVAIFLALLLSPAVSALARIGVPAWLGAALVLLALFGALATLLFFSYAPLERWLNVGPGEAALLREKLRALSAPLEAIRRAAERFAPLAEGDAPQAIAVTPAWSAASLASGARRFVFPAMVTVMLLYFVLASGDTFLRKAVRLVPGLRGKIRTVRVSREIQAEMVRYFWTLAIINAGLGSAVAIAMWSLGMPAPLLLGGVAALFNFVPYLGPAATVGLIAAVAFVQFGTPLAILAPPLAAIACLFVESQLAAPLLLGHRFELHPVALLVWALAWAWIWGLVGMLIAVPLLVALRICADHFAALAPFGQLIARE